MPLKSEVIIRPATPGDSAACGKICYQAFSTLSAKHNFPDDFPSAEVATGMLLQLFSSSDFFCVVAEKQGRIVGSNCLDERSIIAGIGPISIDPSAQNLGVGRQLMQAVMDRANQRCPAGTRLVQAAYHNRSLSLYVSLGFDIREPLSCIQVRPNARPTASPRQRTVPGCTVRPAQLPDLEACNALSHRIHGFARAAELSQAIQENTAKVVERNGRITGYASALAFFGHATAETNPDLQALLASADSFAGPGILLPSRNTALLRWCLANHMQVTQPMTLMTVGLYNEPAGSWFPSILF
jgi:predicted N-acetyltransferase YhbS